jgi:hypothetical protein
VCIKVLKVRVKTENTVLIHIILNFYENLIAVNEIVGKFFYFVICWLFPEGYHMFLDIMSEIYGLCIVIMLGSICLDIVELQNVKISWWWVG